jgi:D-sedoheptulose 7-phosphate isomerase
VSSNGGNGGRVAAQVIDNAHWAIGRLRGHTVRIEHWAWTIRDCLTAGGLVMAAGNGGSATHADHLVGELIGRFRRERAPLRAVSLNADQCALTAIANDYGFEQVFARQVAGLARPGDVVVLFSTSGRSPNVLRAAEVATGCGARVLACTGPAPNPLASHVDDALAVDGPDTAAIQDAHHVALHAICAVLDELVADPSATPIPTAEVQR